MKKLLFVLACAASLGLWISCDNGAQDLDITLHSGVDSKSYQNDGTVTAKKVTMVTHKVEKVAHDSNGKIIVKTDRKDYYIGTVQELTADKKSVDYVDYWFYNDWDAGQEITFDRAFVRWNDNVNYNGNDSSGGKEYVSNSKEYSFEFHRIDDDGWIGGEVILDKSGNNVYQRTEEDWYNDFGTAALEVSGNLEGNFEIKTLLKKLDSKYGEKEEGENYGSGSKYRRLDEQVSYYFNGSEYVEKVVEEADTWTYYYTDVKFTKN